MQLMPNSVKALGLSDHELAARYTSTTVLITAFSCAQVEKLARSIHAASALAPYTLVRVSACGLPRDHAMLKETCANVFAAAAGGTLLLESVEEMPASAQEYLVAHLEGLQQRGTASAVRVIAGTTVSMIDRIGSGAFSEELFYRLNTIHLVVADPPLKGLFDDDNGRERSRRLDTPDRDVL